MNPTEFLEAMVRLPSPPGQEGKVVEFLRGRAAADGFRVLDDSVGNFVAETGAGDKLLLFVGHLDTVPGNIPVRRDGDLLWGRGTVDAKGPFAAAYAAALRHRDDPGLRIRLVGAIDEEGHSLGAKAVPTDLAPEWILIGEPSGHHGLTLGYKGILRGGYQVVRSQSHGAAPDPTAVEAALEFWRNLERRYRFADRFESVQGRLDSIQTVSDGLNDRVDVRFNLRLPPDVDLAVMEEELARAAESQKVTLDIEERVRGAEAPKQTSLVAAFLAVIRARTGEPHLKRKTGTADFNLFAHRHPTVPIAAYGPGDSGLDHTPNERIDLRHFAESIEVLDEVFTRLAQGSATPAVRGAASEKAIHSLGGVPKPAISRPEVPQMRRVDPLQKT